MLHQTVLLALGRHAHELPHARARLELRAHTHGRVGGDAWGLERDLGAGRLAEAPRPQLLPMRALLTLSKSLSTGPMWGPRRPKRAHRGPWPPYFPSSAVQSCVVGLSDKTDTLKQPC